MRARPEGPPGHRPALDRGRRARGRRSAGSSLLAALLLVGWAGCDREPSLPFQGDAAVAPNTHPDLAVACGFNVFPQFNKACTTFGDCFVALHEVDCCGTLVATGVAATDKAIFETAEATCRRQWGSCACPARPTSAEDGKLAPTTNGGGVAIACTMGVCRTFIP